jgi:hypothetical protein
VLGDLHRRLYMKNKACDMLCKEVDRALKKARKEREEALEKKKKGKRK